MRGAGAIVLCLLLSPFAFSQTSDSNRSGSSPSLNTAPAASQTQSPAAQTSAPLTLRVWNPADSAPQAQPPAQTPQPPSYANYSIMLVGPPGGTAVVLMHNPNNGLEFVEVNNTKQALSAGYVPVRAAELGEFIGALKEENAQLADENTRLRVEVAKLVPDEPTSASQTELEAQQRAQIDADKAARRQQIIQSWLMLQNMNRTRTLNLNIHSTDCTRFPAACVGR